MTDAEILSAIRKAATDWRQHLASLQHNVIARQAALDMLNALDPAMIEGRAKEREALALTISETCPGCLGHERLSAVADAILKAGWHR